MATIALGELDKRRKDYYHSSTRPPWPDKLVQKIKNIKLLSLEKGEMLEET